ncbi:MAG: ABC transporter permease [Candidatus Thermoplasmatota archaeon]|nr:ABC transporter permease [Candidatus Thermoplasmatota archaeon]
MPETRSRLSPLLKWSIVSFGIVCFILIIVLPVSSMFKFALEDGPYGFWKAITTENALNALKNSLLMASLATGINLVVGTTIAFSLTRYRFPGSSIFRALIDLPIAIPASVVGLALMMLYGPKGLLGPFFESNGIQIIFDLPGIVLAHVFVTFPFMVRAVSVVIEKFDHDLEDAAVTLGANGFQTFFRVMLPSIKSGLIAGSALTFTRSLGEFGATLIVFGGAMHLRTGPLYMYYLSDSAFDFQGATSVAILLMVVPFVLLLTVNAIVSRMEVSG